MIPSLIACTTCRVTMVEAGGDAAGWSIFTLLLIILPVLIGTAWFMIRIARRERENFDPAYSDPFEATGTPVFAASSSTSSPSEVTP